MRNTYMIVAFLPLLFQGAVYGADLNAMIKTELEQARKISHYSGPLKFDGVLKSLVAHGKKSDFNSIKAINAIKDIKNALLQYRSEQYTSNWYNITAYFKSNSEKVTQEIDPAILKVNNALKELQKNASIYGFIQANLLAITILTIGGTVGTVGTVAVVHHFSGRLGDFSHHSDGGGSVASSVSIEPSADDIRIAASAARTAADAAGAQVFVSEEDAQDKGVRSLEAAFEAVRIASQALRVAGGNVDNPGCLRVKDLARAAKVDRAQSPAAARAAADYADSVAQWLDSKSKTHEKL